jgi:hypothetical protein
MHLLKQHLEYLISNIFSSKATEKFKVVCHKAMKLHSFGSPQLVEIISGIGSSHVFTNLFHEIF